MYKQQVARLEKDIHRYKLEAKRAQGDQKETQSKLDFMQESIFVTAPTQRSIEANKDSVVTQKHLSSTPLLDDQTKVFLANS